MFACLLPLNSFESESPYIALTSLELTVQATHELAAILLSQPPECQVYGCGLPDPACASDDLITEILKVFIRYRRARRNSSVCRLQIRA